jgi:hypothetical protein
MKIFLKILLAFSFITNTYASDLIRLACKVSSITTELEITLNESNGKASLTYKANSTGFNSDAQFNSNEIIFQKKVNSLNQVEKFTINRKTLEINHSVFMYNKGDPTVNSTGMCNIRLYSS